MTVKTVRRAVPYTADQMYRLAADIERYPEFLPYCKALRIVRREGDARNGTLTADMLVAYHQFREKFRSDVTLREADHLIEARYANGPFKRLENSWRFTPAPEGGCLVDFHIDFEFRGLVLQTTARAVFEPAFSKIMSAFEARAEQLYGAPSPKVLSGNEAPQS